MLIRDPVDAAICPCSLEFSSEEPLIMSTAPSVDHGAHLVSLPQEVRDEILRTLFGRGALWTERKESANNSSHCLVPTKAILNLLWCSSRLRQDALHHIARHSDIMLPKCAYGCGKEVSSTTHLSPFVGAMSSVPKLTVRLYVLRTDCLGQLERDLQLAFKGVRKVTIQLEWGFSYDDWMTWEECMAERYTSLLPGHLRHRDEGFLNFTVMAPHGTCYRETQLHASPIDLNGYRWLRWEFHVKNHKLLPIVL
jgi:hypothetical protein